MAGNTTLDLTVQVLDLSPKLTMNELSFFFSYCGTVHSIHLQRRDNDQSQIAFVTFVQPYAYRTALLLNGAVIAGKPIQVLPLKGSTIHSNPHNRNNVPQSKENGGFLPMVQAAFESMASKGIGIMNKRKVELEEKFKLKLAEREIKISG